ncbi:hypothetical protein K6119_04130 [Paracrocinitomix mangrovi]|uniref:hypothetical protein n=1 Tax=Paracrocinitomix mangrovi TaxID=2862509 RepID=UPI001C8EBAD4|nr:hypothetical protein [Paracrocinitomix mangrovi]UKN02701.1 hypothetical protein K6119_04130 [Paracrocinitomix mangrovi]
MKKLIIFSLLLQFTSGYSQKKDSCRISLFEGVNNILIGQTTLNKIKEEYSGIKIIKRRHRRSDISSRLIEKIVLIDSLDLEIHLKKQSLKNIYWVYSIKIKDNCQCRTVDGIGIGSSRDDIGKIYPSIFTDHTSRVIKYHWGNEKSTQFSIWKGSFHVSFIDKGWVNADQFVTEEIELYYSDLRIVNAYRLKNKP